MIRTRDLFLFAIVIVFLVVAIGTTVVRQYISGDAASEKQSTQAIELAAVPDREYAVDIDIPESVTREERVAAMRQKIAEGGELAISTPENIPTTNTETVEEEVEDTDEAGVTTGPQRCAQYQPFQGVWSPQGIEFEVVEGSRVVYQEIASEYKLEPETATSGAALPRDTRQEVLAQLPINTIPTSSSHCLPSDVIGIAQDGSLIRNTEVGLYSVFGDNTLIGYALDGYPIYGVTQTAGDVCGGVVVNGQYRYYLSSERETILNCFVGVPVSL